MVCIFNIQVIQKGNTVAKGKSYHWHTNHLEQAHQQAKDKQLKLNQYLDQLVLKDAKTTSGQSIQEELDELRADLDDLWSKFEMLEQRIERVDPSPDYYE